MSRKLILIGASTASGEKDSEGGFLHYLRTYLKNQPSLNFVVYNLGIPGNTTTDILNRFESEISTRVAKDDDQNIILIMPGTNDSAIWIEQNKPKLNVLESTKNITQIINLAKKFTSKIVFIGSPLPDATVFPAPWNPKIGYKTELVEEYNRLCSEICNGEQVKFVDVSSVSFVDLIDGLHPGTIGHKKIFELVYNKLRTLKYI